MHRYIVTSVNCAKSEHYNDKDIVLDIVQGAWYVNVQNGKQLSKPKRIVLFYSAVYMKAMNFGSAPRPHPWGIGFSAQVQQILPGSGKTVLPIKVMRRDCTNFGSAPRPQPWGTGKKHESTSESPGQGRNR